MAEVATAFVSLLPSARGFGKATEAQISPQMKAAGKVAAVAGVAAMGAFAKGAIDLEAQFSKTMNQFQAATDLPAEGMRRMQGLAIEMGAKTVFSAAAASDAMLALAKSGIKPAAIEAGALEAALTLAAAGELDMGTAAETMGNALNTFSLQAKDAAAVSAALAGAANASSASVQSVTQGLAQVGTVAADAGFTVQETTGAIAALAQAGIQGSDAGTSLKTMFANLTPMTEKAFDAMQRYGLVNYDANIASKVLAEDGIKALGTSYRATYKAVEKHMIAQGEGEKGTAKLAKATKGYMQVSGIMHNAFLKQNGDFKSLASIAGTLDDNLSDLSDSERATALTTMFGSDARRAATVLMNEGTKGLAEYIKATSDVGAAEKMAEAGMKGTAGAVEMFKGSLETVQLQLGLLLAPTIQSGLGTLTAGLNKISDSGPALAAFFDKVGGGASTLHGAVSDLWRAFNPGGATVKAAQDALASIGDALGDALGGTRDLVTDAFKNINVEPAVRAIGRGFRAMDLSGLADNFSTQAKGWAAAIIDGLKTGLDTGDWSGLGKTVGTGLASAIEGGAKLAVDIGKAVSDLLGKVDWMGIGIAVGKQVPTLLVGLAAGLLNFDLGGLLSGLAAHWQDVLLAVLAVAFAPAKIVAKVAGLLRKVPLIGPLLSWALLAFKKFSDSVLGLASKAIGFLGRGFMQGFRRVFPNTGKAFTEQLKILPTRLGLMAITVREKALAMVKGMGAGIAKGIGTVVAKIGELIARMLRPFASAGSWLIGKGRSLLAGLGTGITKAVGGVLHLAGSLGAKVLRAVGDFGSLLASKGKDLIQGLVGGILSKVEDVKGAVGKVTDAIGRFFPGSPVKEGPLTKWNRGAAGQRLVGMLASGLSDTAPVERATARLASRVQVPNLRLDETMGTSPGQPAAPGGVHISVASVQPHDYRAFLGDMQRQTQRAALGGYA